MNPTFSIITVCLNSSSTIHRTLDSVLQQEYTDFEYIVQDGGSEDGTLDIIKDYEDIFQEKGIDFTWENRPDRGIYDAINRGIAKADGNIIGILHSDDWYESYTLKKVAEAEKKFPDAGIYYGYLRSFKNNKEIHIHRFNYDNYLLDLDMGVYSATQHPACFIKKYVYNQIGFYDVEFSTSADYDFLLRVAKNGIKFKALDVILTNFSFGGVSSRLSDNEMFLQRYKIWYKNGFIDKTKLNRLLNNLRYKSFKSKIINSILKFFKLNKICISKYQ